MRYLILTILLTACGTEDKKPATTPTSQDGVGEIEAAPAEEAAPVVETKPVAPVKAAPVKAVAKEEVKVVKPELTSPSAIWLDEKTGKHWTLMPGNAAPYDDYERKCAAAGSWRLPIQSEWTEARADSIPVGSDEEGWSISAVWVAPGSTVPILDGATGPGAFGYCIEK